VRDLEPPGTEVSACPRDPSLRLKSGSGQDDAIGIDDATGIDDAKGMDDAVGIEMGIDGFETQTAPAPVRRVA
jgi:hypothetical protein